MTVRELIEKLEQFPDNCFVMIPDPQWHLSKSCPYIHVTSVAQGVNEMDGCVIIDDYVEDEDEEDSEQNDCAGCIYEDADGSTSTISNCVCCSRNVDFAKNDYYKKRY